MPVAILRALLLLTGLVLLGACAPRPETPVSEEVWRNSIYRSNGPAEIALVTNIANRNSGGAHSALIIDGPERVVYNPFGTWSHPNSPERGDLHRNFGPEMEKWFIDYHARETFRVQIQRVQVPPEVAAMALERAKAMGPKGMAQCTRSISTILHGLPGFEDFPIVWYPNQARDAFAKIPGVRSTVYVDDSPGDWSDLSSGWDGQSNVQIVPQHNMAVAVPRDRTAETN